MRARLLPAALAVVLPALAPRAHAQGATPAAAAGASVPAGWRFAMDRATMPADQARLAPMGGGWHATMGRAAGVFYDPGVTAAGAYTVEATFTQTKAPTHPEAYGLVVGARGLDAGRPDYLYFVVRGDGKFMVRHRAGDEVHTLTDWTASPALKPADAAGRATNALRVVAARDSVRFLANGAEVARFPRAAYLNLDGVVGLRVNHALDVHVDGPRVTPAR